MNVPNTLTVFRSLLLPVFIAAYFLAPEAYFYLPAVVLAVSGLTDVADGYIARRFHQITPLGRFLDPVADKLTMASVTICLAITHVPLRWLFGIYFVKEMTLALVGLVQLKSWRNSITAKWYGKATTALLYTLMFVVILFPGIPEKILYVLILPPVFFIVLSFIFYLKEIKKHKNSV